MIEEPGKYCNYVSCVHVCFIKGMTAIMIKYLHDQNNIEKIRQIDV